MKENNDKETYMINDVFPVEYQIKEETILNAQLPIKIDPYVANVSKSLLYAL